MSFRCFVIISPWRKGWPFIWTNLNPLDPRMLCAKFCLNWPSGSWEEENVKSLTTTTTTATKIDNWQILIRKAHLILQLRWAKYLDQNPCSYISKYILIWQHFSYNCRLYKWNRVVQTRPQKPRSFVTGGCDTIKNIPCQAARSLINQESKFCTLASWNTRNFIKQVKFIDKDNDFQTLS